MKTVTLHATAHATGKAAEHILVFVPDPLTNWDHVTRTPVLRINRTKYMIEQRSLFKLRILHLGLYREKLPRHLEHVVNVATLVRAAIDAFAQLVRWSKVFILAMASRRIGVIIHDGVPKELSCDSVCFIARIDVTHQHA